VAELFVGDRFINAEMVKAGLAYEYRPFSGKFPNKLQIRNAEAIAQRNKVGVWDGGDYRMPWDFRRSNR
jgi:endonuclease YncB( thermonuclease family)